MFFNSHKKKGREAGNTALNIIIKKSFIGTKYFDDVTFSPPSNFYEDKYIRGFITNYLDLLRMFAFNGKGWSVTKKGEFLLEAFNIIDPTNTLKNKHMEMAMDINIALEFRDNVKSRQGYEDSTSFVAIAYNKLKPDDPDPIIVEARKLAPKLAEQNENLGVTGNENEHLATAIYMLTFYKYVREIWN